MSEQQSEENRGSDGPSSEKGSVDCKIDVIPFREALDMAGEPSKRHLMLGNGFSIALRPDIFSYNTLLERAKESGRLTDEMAEVFRELRTTDFEKVMAAHENAAVLVTIYDKENPDLAKRMKEVAAQLRDLLARTIAENHPERPYHIGRQKYASCRSFLANFGGSLYTLNYDLLLYWTLMQNELPPALRSDDGFRDAEEGEQEYVVWDVQNTNKQNIHYLHGALHIYDAGAELLKYTWSKTDVPLVDQIRRALDQRKYPLIVTEGTCDQKKEKIQHSGYLNRAYQSFSQISGSLFVYGHSFAENDEHLLKLIEKGKVERLFVGLYGKVELPGNQKIINRAKLMRQRREDAGNRLELHFYDSASAHVWDDEGFDEKASPVSTNRLSVGVRTV